MSETSLAWPPPGLESLHGQLWPLARRLGFAAMVVVVAVLWFGTGGNGGIDASTAAATRLVQLALAIGGCGLLLSAASAAWVLGNRTTACVHRGYTWRIVLEVLADSQGDTGKLIAGDSDYATLSISTRDRVRVLRLLRALVAFIAAAFPVPALLVLASGRAGERLMTWGPVHVLGPSIALLLIVAILGIAARAPLRALRRERDQTLFKPGAPPRIVEPWYAAFSRTRTEGALGAGRRGGSLYGLFAAAVVGAILLVAVAIIIPLMLVVSIGAHGVSGFSQRSGQTAARVARAERLRAFAFASDTTISPLRAGQALFALSPFLRSTQRGPSLNPVVRTFAPLPWASGSGFGTVYRTHARLQQVVLERAANGVDATQRAFLDSVARHPAWEEYAIVARALRVDLADAMLALPLGDHITFADLPSNFLSGATELSYANVSRAAWHLANGRRADAELVLRETASFGFRVMDNAHSNAGVSLGATIVVVAHDALIRLYSAIGDSTRAAELAALVPDNPRRSVPTAFLADRQALLRTLADPLTPSGVKWDLVRLAAFATCGNVREVLLGPSPGLRQAIEAARASLVRTPAEAEIFRVNAEHLERYARQPRRGMFVAMARIPSVLLGNPRIAQCAALMT